MTKTKKLLPAGKYYVGDPCYVLGNNDKTWSEFLKAFEKVGTSTAVFEFKGHKCFVANTDHGDGVYYDQDDNQYPVDAGMIGAIPLDLIEDKEDWNVDFFVDFPVSATKAGAIKVGHLKIDTGW